MFEVVIVLEYCVALTGVRDKFIRSQFNQSGRLKQATWMLAFLVASLSADRRAYPDVITDHALAVVQGSVSVEGGLGSQYSQGSFQINTAAASGEAFAEWLNPFESQFATSKAQVTDDSTGWHLSTSSSYVDQLTYGSQFPTDVDFAKATATWTDIGFLGNTNPAVVGHTIRLTFTASGKSSSAPQAGGHAPNTTQDTQTNTASGTNATNDLSFSKGATSSVEVQKGLIGGNGVKNFTSSWHVDIPIIQGGGFLSGDPGSFLFQVTAQSESSGPSSQFSLGTTVGGNDPVGFLSVTLPDVGNVTPESLGVSLSFDSGFASPNAVPEPCSFALLVLGGIGLAIGANRRRRMAAV